MKKIIDVSAFAFPETEGFLRASPHNRAILTDFAAIETFKRHGVENVQRAFGAFAPFANQVLILRPTGVISLLRPRRKGLQSRLIDEDATAGFPGFVQALSRAHEPEARAILRQIESRHSKASAFMEQLTRDAEQLKTGILAIGRSYPADTLAAIRSRSPLPEGFHEAAGGHILQLTAALMTQLFPANKPHVPDIFYSYPFRYATAMYCLNLFWTATGDVTTVPTHKIRNDATDMTYVAHATFFDGIITRDGKLDALHRLTKGFLTGVFRI